MNKKYSYVGVAFVILLFGIYVVRNIESRFQKSDLYTFEKVPAFEFTTDNAAMIAIVGYLKYLEGDFADQTIMATARLKL